MLREADSKMKNERLEQQKNYKDYLDQQKEKKIFDIQNEKKYDISTELIMPSYHYPNKPVPTSKAAKDSISVSKNHHNFFDKDMNKFFQGDSQYETLISYSGKNYYLGDTRLRHNPITHPINDAEYNKYVVKLKKNVDQINRGESPSPSNNTFIKNGNNIIA
jgi:hypothetical protein